MGRPPSRKSTETFTALIMVLPVVFLLLLIFFYPTASMFYTSLTNAPLIGPGEWVGLDNYVKQISSPLFHQALWNTLYFVALSVIPGTGLALVIAMAVSGRNGWVQSLLLFCFFLPSVLPVSVVANVWNWMGNLQYGVLQPVLSLFNSGRPLPLYRLPSAFLPSVAVITIWWTTGFSVLFFMAAIRNISRDIYEAAALDNAGSWRVFTKITWPLIWPITSLVLILSFIAQFKLFTQAYILSTQNNTPIDGHIVIMRLLYDLAFTQNKGGEGASVATLLFAVIMIASYALNRFLRAGELK